MKDWLSRSLRRILRPPDARNSIHLQGPFESWDVAVQIADGYSAQAIFERVSRSALAVRDGRAVCERDGVAFDAPQVPVWLLQRLVRLGEQNGGRLTILDFGGSLGSTYFQCRQGLRGFDRLSWKVVEQPHFVEFGAKELGDGVLSFASDLDAVLAQETFDVAVFSGVLQYLEHPLATLDAMHRAGVPQVLIDRTPMIETPQDVFAVQYVPPAIYGQPVTYPIRLFARSSLLAAVASRWGETEVGPASFDGPMMLAGAEVRSFALAGPVIDDARN